MAPTAASPRSGVGRPITDTLPVGAGSGSAPVGRPRRRDRRWAPTDQPDDRFGDLAGFPTRVSTTGKPGDRYAAASSIASVVTEG
jgi:hypothetical protein